MTIIYFVNTTALYEDEKRLCHFLENFDALFPSIVGIETLSDGGAARIKAIKSYYFNNDLTANKSLVSTNELRIVNKIFVHKK